MELIFTPSKLAKKGERFVGSGNADTLVDIAKQLKIHRIDNLSWELVIKPWGKKGFRLDGKIKAKVAQACVISLIPVLEQIDETIDLRFVPEEATRETPKKQGIDEDFNFDATPEDEPEMYSGDIFDVMPFVIEHLALGLNPYPKAPDAAFVETEANSQETSALTRALEAWSAKKAL